MKLLDTIKLLSCLAAFLLFFPLIMLIDGFDDLSGFIWVSDMLAAAAFGFFGYIIRMALSLLEDRKPVIGRSLLILIAIAAAVGAFFIFSANPLRSTPSAVLLSALCLTLYIQGCRYYFYNYSLILNGFGIIFSAVGNLLVILILFISKHPYSPELMIFFYFIAFLIFAVEKSQGNIDYLMERRRHSEQNLPPKVRAYTVRLIIIISGFSALLFLFKDGISAVFLFLGKLIKTVGIASMELAKQLSELTGGEAEMIDELPKPSEVLPAEEIPQVTTHPILNALFYLFGFTLIIILIIKNFKSAVSAVRDAFRKLLKLISEVSAKFSRKKDEDEECGFTDSEEFLSADETASNKQLPRRKQISEWKRLVKEYKKMPVSPEKYRKGFKAALDGFRLTGTEISPVFTTGQIGELEQVKNAFSEYSPTASVYDIIRYGESPDDPDFTSLEQLIDSLCKKI